MLHLDHIIVLVPYASLQDPPSWITNNFTLSPGGRHADGKTENKIICFKDGSYIELIAFVNDDSENRRGHWWGSKKLGIIDFALTDSSGDADIQYSELKERLKKLDAVDSTLNIDYAEPVAGGRKRPDGEDVKWKVTFPVLNEGRQRGEYPFFCHDVTSRDLRVPLEGKNVDHPSGAYGIKELNIYLAPAKLDIGLKAYPAILGVPNSNVNGTNSAEGKYTLGRLYKVEGTSDPSFKLQAPLAETLVKAVAERNGVHIGNLVIACSGPEQNMHQIDIGESGIGGVFLDSKE